MSPSSSPSYLLGSMPCSTRPIFVPFTYMQRIQCPLCHSFHTHTVFRDTTPCCTLGILIRMTRLLHLRYIILHYFHLLSHALTFRAYFPHSSLPLPLPYSLYPDFDILSPIHFLSLPSWSTSWYRQHTISRRHTRRISFSFISSYPSEPGSWTFFLSWPFRYPKSETDAESFLSSTGPHLPNQQLGIFLL